MGRVFECQLTAFGFNWGPVTVSRTFDDVKGVGMTLETVYDRLQVWVTPKGHIRVALDSKKKGDKFDNVFQANRMKGDVL